MTTKGPFFSELEDRYRKYLADVRALCPDTITCRTRFFRRFRNFLKAGRVRSARRVSLDLVYAFLEECSRGRSRSNAVTLHGWMRSILQFLRFARVLRRDLSRDMIAPRMWGLAGVPGTFSEEDIARIFAELRSGTSYELRERAIVLLFFCYGLRLSEVRLMKVGDIDFRTKTLSIPERKNRVPLVLPLLPAVEQAVRAYLEGARPAGLRTNRLFVALRRRHRAPLTREMMRLIVTGFLRRCGLGGPTKKFRHTLATRLINGGVDLHVIQAVLGHASLDSTWLYAKVHLEALREVAENSSMLL
jgi:site-specific recombinase XerD